MDKAQNSYFFFSVFSKAKRKLYTVNALNKRLIIILIFITMTLSLAVLYINFFITDLVRFARFFVLNLKLKG